MEIAVRQVNYFFHVKSGMFFFFLKRKWCLVAVCGEENLMRARQGSDWQPQKCNWEYYDLRKYSSFQLRWDVLFTLGQQNAFRLKHVPHRCP